MKDYCMSCTYFTSINEDVGYCTMLGVAVEKGVVILDAFSTLYGIGEDEAAEIYNFVVVQSRFGCVCYKRMVML